MKLKLLLIFLLLPHLGFSYYLCHPCCSRNQLAGWWGTGEYLLLWRKDRHFPPLVTTNPDSMVLPALDVPGTTILFGDKNYGGSPRSGARADLGIWLTRCMGFGGTIFGIKDEKIKFNETGDQLGNPIFGQPFNTPAGTQTANLLSFPIPIPFINGLIDIDSTNRFWGGDLYGRYRFFCSSCFRFDLLAGFQFNEIVDNLDISSQTTQITGLDPFTFTDIAIADHFKCRNQFYGGLAGFNAEWRTTAWAFQVVGKLGIGNMQKITKIQGYTNTTEDGVTITQPVGLYSQGSNTGKHSLTKFEVVSQINANVQLRFWSHFWATLGYMYMFWPAVALAGEQLNLTIDKDNSTSPPFREVRRSFWAQGLTAGLYVCY